MRNTSAFPPITADPSAGPRSLINVADWFASVCNDLVDDNEEIAWNTSEAEALRLIERNYVSGDCGAFAVALHRLTGWPIYAFEGFAHYVIRTPRGALIDIKGYTTLTKLQRRYGMPQARLRKSRPEDAWDEANDLDPDSPWSAVNLARFVIGQLTRRPFPRLTQRLRPSAVRPR